MKLLELDLLLAPIETDSVLGGFGLQKGELSHLMDFIPFYTLRDFSLVETSFLKAFPLLGIPSQLSNHLFYLPALQLRSCRATEFLGRAKNLTSSIQAIPSYPKKNFS